MTVRTREVDLQIDGIACSGLFACDDEQHGPGPGILVCHTIRGRTAFEEGKAHDLAAAGYAALAVDLYGTHTRDDAPEQLRSHMGGLLDDRVQLGARLKAWHGRLAALPEVDAGSTAAIGFCFGGLCALDLARADIDIRGVASFHGLLKSPPEAPAAATATRVLVMHGWDDPLAPPDDVLALAREFSDLGADWQLHAYGHTVHAFTNPIADDHSAGTVYNAAADKRSGAALMAFLDELFA